MILSNSHRVPTFNVTESQTSVRWSDRDFRKHSSKAKIKDLISTGQYFRITSREKDNSTTQYNMITRINWNSSKFSKLNTSESHNDPDEEIRPFHSISLSREDRKSLGNKKINQIEKENSLEDYIKYLQHNGYEKSLAENINKKIEFQEKRARLLKRFKISIVKGELKARSTAPKITSFQDIEDHDPSRLPQRLESMFKLFKENDRRNFLKVNRRNDVNKYHLQKMIERSASPKKTMPPKESKFEELAVKVKNLFRSVAIFKEMYSHSKLVLFFADKLAYLETDLRNYIMTKDNKDFVKPFNFNGLMNRILKTKDKKYLFFSLLGGNKCRPCGGERNSNKAMTKIFSKMVQQPKFYDEVLLKSLTFLVEVLEKAVEDGQEQEQNQLFTKLKEGKDSLNHRFVSILKNQLESSKSDRYYSYKDLKSKYLDNTDNYISSSRVMHSDILDKIEEQEYRESYSLKLRNIDRMKFKNLNKIFRNLNEK